MSDLPIFAMGDNGFWSGISRDRALEWTRVFLRHYPSVPGTIIWMVRPNLAKGIPAGFSDWARRAEDAEAIGFTPERYEQLQEMLDALDPQRFPAHPDNRPITRGLKPVRPFDGSRWASWNRLVDGGLAPEAATVLLLLGEH